MAANILNRFFWVIVCTLVIAITGVTLFYLRSENVKKERLRQQEQLLSLSSDVEGTSTQSAQTRETEPTMTPSPTPETNLALVILNGSGIAGEAGRAKIVLEDGDITVTETGNAKRYNYLQSEIRTKQTVSKETAQKIFDIFSEKYLVSSSSADLSSTNDYDIEIIVGKGKAKTPTPTP